MARTALGLLVVMVSLLPITYLSCAMAASGMVGGAASKVGGGVGAALGSGAGSAAAGPAAGGSGAGIGGASSAFGGSTGAASGGTGSSGAGAATIVAAAGLGSMADAELVGRAFLASPVATRVAAGRSTRNTVVIKSLYTDAAGRRCRVVEQMVVIDGQTVLARGDICQMPNGEWALVP